ncbi:hypothetical protein IEQ34_001667 [Dendrobium chrysotoxum]|uniref:Glucan endo-1,3-beta-D-glucosidase n=1 Tax=Dendrobium chrysotoxum TaxID=161865 RepID=A0AAV7HPC4_DENCH|nr:hypothetical protein IEQ34_001667 [Dendrobium chrysotoxum]
MKGDNLPSPSQVISLYKFHNIKKLRLFYPYANALSALKNSGIEVILGTYNEDLQSLAGDTSTTTSWVHTNVAPYASAVDFWCIDVGNEVIPDDSANYVLPAMRNIASALHAAGFNILISTDVLTEVLGTSYPPLWWSTVAVKGGGQQWPEVVASGGGGGGQQMEVADKGLQCP